MTAALDRIDWGVGREAQVSSIQKKDSCGLPAVSPEHRSQTLISSHPFALYFALFALLNIFLLHFASFHFIVFCFALFSADPVSDLGSLRAWLGAPADLVVWDWHAENVDRLKNRPEAFPDRDSLQANYRAHHGATVPPCWGGGLCHFPCGCLLAHARVQRSWRFGIPVTRPPPTTCFLSDQPTNRTAPLGRAGHPTGLLADLSTRTTAISPRPCNT